MKLTTILIMVALMQVSAAGFSQATKLSMDFKDQSLEEIFSYIEQNTAYSIFYKNELIENAKLKSGTYKNKDFFEILNDVFEGENLSYEIKGKIILIVSKDELQENAVSKQPIKLTGRVTDSSGSSLPGVTVVVKGTTNGTITDFDGNYSLSKVPGDGVLVFSFVGMKTQEIPVDGKSTINVLMAEDAIGIEEVVAVGYGTMKKVNLTGSVSNVNFEKLATRPSSNTINALAGAVPGLTIIQGGGQPGKDQGAIHIRGIGSVNAGTEPLIVIDGVTSEVDDFGALNPTDISDVSVLKDAAASAIYGARAANGVILITTKNGRSEGTRINFNAYFGMQKATVLPDVLDSWDFAELMNEARVNGNLTEFFSDEQIELMKNDDPSDGFSNTRWLDEVFKTSPIQNYNISLSSGKGKLKTYTSFNYVNQEGIVVNTAADRFNLRSKLDLKLNDHIRFGLNLSGSNKKTNSTRGMDTENDTNVLTNAMRVTPAAPIYYNNGNYRVGFTDVPGYQYIHNPVMYANVGSNTEVDKNFVSAFTAEIKLKGFTFNSQVSYRYTESVLKNWNPKIAIYDDSDVLVYQNDNASLTQKYSNNNRIQIENYLKYDKTIAKKHSISAMLGHTFLQNKHIMFSGYGVGFASNSLQVLDASSNDTQRAYGNEWNNSLQSVFGRINYNYKEKYLFESNIRYDGSSKFAKGNRYGLFPSFSAGWRISEEDFLKDNPLLSNLKLRMSWGELGNQDIGSNYAYASVYSTNTAYLVNGEYTTGAAIVDLANDAISWESTETSNFAVDMGIANKLTLTFEYFIRKTKNMLLKLPIPLTLGNLGAPFQNAGEIQNKGWDLSGNFRDKINDFSYSLNFNISSVENEAIDLNGQEWYPENRIVREGEALNSWYGFQVEGIFQNQDEIDQAATQTPKAVPGDLRYKDISGVDGVPDGKINSYDRTIIGDDFPQFTFGFGGNFNYRNFDCSIFFQGIANKDVYTFNNVNTPGNRDNNNWTVDWLNRWTPENPSTEYPRLAIGRDSNVKFSDYWMEDGSYLRLKNIELGYSFSKAFLNKLSIDNLRFYVGGQNLLTFSKLKHFDPERSGGSTGFSYPQLKVYQIGLNVTF
ncbi:TonB-dependent receptor [Sunxiuqinia sp. A32]|uniref:TonB-dependent receptor n=1 Tax=Sunxiuqinia sp. A32 TaxID=3461496 RepID=UPI00404580EB